MLGEGEKGLELFEILLLLPLLMITILLPLSLVSASCLQVSGGVGANPDRLVSGWNHERLDAVAILALGQAGSVGVEVGEPSSVPLPGETGFLVGGES